MFTNLRKHWKRWLSIATGITAVAGMVLTGAASIFDMFVLDQWGRLLALIVSALCMYFGVNAGIKIVNSAPPDAASQKAAEISNLTERVQALEDEKSSRR